MNYYRNVSLRAFFLLTAILNLQIAFAQDALGPYPPTALPDRINLTVTQDPSTSMAVTWRTHPATSDGLAEIVPANPNPLSVREAKSIRATSQRVHTKDGNYKELTWKGVDAAYHSVVFEDLQPNTLYAYRVGDGANWSEWFQFRTAGSEADKLSLLYFGDAQT